MDRTVPRIGAKPRRQIDLRALLLKLQNNCLILKEQEAKCGATAASIRLLNQIDDYEQAIALIERALAHNLPLTDLQAGFRGLNLEIDTVVFVAQEPPRNPFTGQNPYRGLRKFTEDEAEFFFGRRDAIQSLLKTINPLLEVETGPNLSKLVAVLGPDRPGVENPPWSGPD